MLNTIPLLKFDTVLQKLGLGDLGSVRDMRDLKFTGKYTHLTRKMPYSWTLEADPLRYYLMSGNFSGRRWLTYAIPHQDSTLRNVDIGQAIRPVWGGDPAQTKYVEVGHGFYAVGVKTGITDDITSKPLVERRVGMLIPPPK